MGEPIGTGSDSRAVFGRVNLQYEENDMNIPQIKKILYATDLTKNSAYAFSYAVDMAKKHNATIVILHVLPALGPSVYGDAGVRVVEMMKEGKKREREMDIEEIRKNIREFCQKMEDQLGCPCVQLVSEILVPTGYTVDEILKTAEDEGCDAIVLGTHGKGFLRHTFLGSVAADVLERTRKPVFIIPLPADKTDIEWKRI
jgi:nucleotide-binding universal stress UspA family protein